MPALPPIQHVLKAVVNFTQTNANCVNIFHISYAGLSPTGATCNLIAQQVHSAWSQNFIPKLAANVNLLDTQIFDLSNPLAATGSYTLHIPGANGTMSAANNVAIVGSWKINNRYRGGKPRTYITGLPTVALQDSRTWLPSTVADMQTAFNGFMVNINGMNVGAGTGPYTLGVVHYKLAHANLNPPTFDAFQSVNVLNLVRSQRGRLT